MAKNRATESPRKRSVSAAEVYDRIPLGSRFGGTGSDSNRGRVANWSDADAMDLFQAITAVTGAGDALMFGRTRDGGALVCTVLSDSDRRKFYPTDAGSIAHALRQITAAYSDPRDVDPATRELRKKD